MFLLKIEMPPALCEYSIRTMTPEEAFEFNLELYAHKFGERWVIEQCQSFTLKCLRYPTPKSITIETDSLCDDEVEILPTPKPTPPPEPKHKILRMKKSAPLPVLSSSSPQAQQNLVETLKKSNPESPKKKSVIRDIQKLVKQGFLTVGSKVVPSAIEISPTIYGTIVMDTKGKPGIQPSWNENIVFTGKYNAPMEFLLAVTKQYPKYNQYHRENAWNDVLKVNPGGGYVSLADLWIQSR